MTPNATARRSPEVSNYLRRHNAEGHKVLRCERAGDPVTPDADHDERTTKSIKHQPTSPLKSALRNVGKTKPTRRVAFANPIVTAGFLDETSQHQAERIEQVSFMDTTPDTGPISSEPVGHLGQPSHRFTYNPFQSVRHCDRRNQFAKETTPAGGPSYNPGLDPFRSIRMPDVGQYPTDENDSIPVPPCKFTFDPFKSARMTDIRDQSVEETVPTPGPSCLARGKSAIASDPAIFTANFDIDPNLITFDEHEQSPGSSIDSTASNLPTHLQTPQRFSPSCFAPLKKTEGGRIKRKCHSSQRHRSKGAVIALGKHIESASPETIKGAKVLTWIRAMTGWVNGVFDRAIMEDVDYQNDAWRVCVPGAFR